jgi:L-serine dehydratase
MTDAALVAGLTGARPETVDPEFMGSCVAVARNDHRLSVLDEAVVPFEIDRDLIFHMGQSLPRHPNGMRFVAFGSDQVPLYSRDYYSIGGGFVVEDTGNSAAELDNDDVLAVPFPFETTQQLLRHCRTTGWTIADVVLANEQERLPRDLIQSQLDRIWSAMRACISRGLTNEGILPGGLRIRRRAPTLYKQIKDRPQGGDPLAAMDWVTVSALAVNEENAAGGRVVTAPTNGAAGVVPAVLAYHLDIAGGSPSDVGRFLLTAGAIATICKQRASLSGAEVGCQGEIGSASAMAAAGLAAVTGATPAQVENAAEIAMEHHLGLTCDPVGGLVQVPCIERNAVAAVHAITATRLALSGDGQHRVSFDDVVQVMRQTGEDMHTKYKETSLGGLDVSIIEC